MDLIRMRRLLEFDATIAWIIVIASIGWMNVTDPDFFWHLKNGELLNESGGIFTEDTYSHTARGTPIQITGWFFDAALAWIWNTFGLSGIRFASAIFIFLTWLGVYQCVRLYISRNQTAAILALLSIVLLAPLIAVRPNLFTHAAFAWVLFFMLHYCRHQKTSQLFYLLPLFFLWPFFHFGFAAGLGLIGLFIASAWMDKVIPLTSCKPVNHLTTMPVLAILLACVVASVLNNYGPAIYPELVSMTVRAGSSPVAEWDSPDFKPLFQKILLASIFLYWLSLFLQQKRTSWIVFVIPAVLLWSLLTAQRNQGFWAVIMPVFLAITISGGINESSDQKNALSRRLERGDPVPRFTYYLNAFLIFMTVVVVVIKAPTITNKQMNSAGELLPVKATDFLLEKVPDGKLYNRYGSGGYLIWRTFPKFPVFVDGRYAPYSDKIIEDARHIMSALPGTISLLEKYGVEIALAETSTALFQTLDNSNLYRLVYSDSDHSVFVKNNQKYQALASVSSTTKKANKE